MCDKTKKKKKGSYLIDASNANSHSLQLTIIMKLQKYTYWKEEPMIIWQLNAVRSALSTIQNWNYSPKLRGRLKLLHLCLGLCIMSCRMCVVQLGRC